MRIFLVLGAVVLSACVGPNSSARYARHFDGANWSTGFRAQFDDPWQYTPELVLLFVAPVAASHDQEVHDQATDHHSISKGNTASGDLIATSMGVATFAWGGWEWSRGDGGQAFEVASESLMSTLVVTQLLKQVTSRDRPHSNTDDSFPSGHTSLAFSAATFLARGIEADTHSKLGYLLWAPATYVAIDRVEAGRHWATDVVAGALLGTVLTNWIWNAHYGAPGASSIFDPRAVQARWKPQFELSDDGLILGLTYSF